MPGLAAANLAAPTLAECGLPPSLSHAVVVYRGKLTPDYLYLDEHLRRSST